MEDVVSAGLLDRAYMRGGVGGRRLSPRGGGGISPQARALKVLMAAPGADVFYDGDYLAGIAKDGSNKVSAMLSRIGVHTVEQSSGLLQPTWGSTSPAGRRGITFTAASSHRLVDPLTTLGGLYDGSQAYSWLLVCKASALITQRMFAFGDAASTAHGILHGMVVTTGLDRYHRVDASNTINDGAAFTTAIVCNTGDRKSVV